MRRANHKVVELLRNFWNSPSSYLGSHFAPSASCTRGFLHPHCEMIGVIICSPVSHGWLIILSQPSYKNSLQASLPRWDEGHQTTVKMSSDSLPFFISCSTCEEFKKENIKHQRTDHVGTLAGHKFYLFSAVIAVLVQRGKTFLPPPRRLQQTQNEATFFWKTLLFWCDAVVWY